MDNLIIKGNIRNFVKNRENRLKCGPSLWHSKNQNNEIEDGKIN